MDSRLKRAAWRGALVGVAAVAAIASAATFNLFQPANGILKGNPSTYITTAAAGGDVIGLWSGTCNNTTYLRGDGACAAPPGTGGGTVSSVGLTMPSGFSVGGSPVTGSSVLAVTTTLSGVLKGTGSGFTTAAASDVVGLFSGCTGTDYLGADGACHVAGTVTSVALTAPSVFAVGGTPVTGAGTLAITFATGQTANEVLASPNGTTGAVGLRALVGADIPAINVAGTGNGGITGSLPFASLSITSANVIGLWTGTCSASTFLRGDGACISPGGGGTVTSVGLTAPSVFTVGGTPVTSSGTLAITFAGGQTANSFLATPNGTTGAVGLRTLVAGDLPSSITSNTSGNAATATALAASPTQCGGGSYSTGIAASGNANCTTAPAGANPSALVGPTAINGSATTFMRSDAAPGINLASNYGWTGIQYFSGNADLGVSPGNLGMIIGNDSVHPIAFWENSNATTDARVWTIYTDTAGFHLAAANDALSTFNDAIELVRGTGAAVAGVNISGGGLEVGAPTGGLLGAGTINAQGIYKNDVAVIALNDSPTATGAWTFTTTTGALTIAPATATWAEDWKLNDGQVSGHSYGAISGYCNGSSAGTWGIYDYTSNTSRLCINSANEAILGAPTGSFIGVTGSLNAQALYVNGVPVLTSAGSGVSKIAAAGISGSSGGCSVVGGAGIASCTTNGTGQWAISFTSSFFSTTPVCNASGNNPTVANNGILISSPSNTIFDVVAFATNTGSLVTSSDFYVICVGS